MDEEQNLWKSARRGQHVRACRKVGLFEHHGVVIAESDLKRIEPSMWPEKIEPILVAEQNTSGLRIVTIENFCTDHLFKRVVYKLNIVQYSAMSEKVIFSSLLFISPKRYTFILDSSDKYSYLFQLHISRPGACRLRACLSEDEIIENVIAILNSPHQRAIWKSYSLCVRNCEQFAVLCCTSELSLGCQISACIEGVKCMFVTGARAGAKAVYDLLIGKHNLARHLLFK